MKKNNFLKILRYTKILNIINIINQNKNLLHDTKTRYN